MRRVLLLLLLLNVSLSLGALRLSLRDRAFVNASAVRLCDVASREDGDRDLYDQLADTVVLELPWELQYRNLYAAEVADAVQEKTGRTVEVAGGVCVVRWEQQNVGEDYLRLLADGFVSQTFNLGKNARVIVDRVPPVRAPRELYEVRFSLASQSPQVLVLRGSVLVEGKEVHSFLLHARVEVTREVLALRAPKRRGEAIAPDDVQTMKQTGSHMSTALTGVEQLNGLQTLRYLPAGTVLDAANTRQRPAVQRGDHVLVTVRGDGVELTLEAEAKHTGDPGDIIPCENTATSQRFDARVTGPGRVEVNLEEPCAIR